VLNFVELNSIPEYNCAITIEAEKITSKTGEGDHRVNITEGVQLRLLYSTAWEIPGFSIQTKKVLFKISKLLQQRDDMQL